MIQNERERFNSKRGYNNMGFRESPWGIQGNPKMLPGKPFAHDTTPPFLFWNVGLHTEP